ncbi:MAG: hypothetical protein KIT11_03405 [Fimbriimonadaceae bacterium]|nr:hypothetical protein [Fimbriimonadaceae bacterium]QYK57056.1 MAG: hypothetical protein KF733_06120 [Fimbriimonadaceae bacterium]
MNAFDLILTSALGLVFGTPTFAVMVAKDSAERAEALRVSAARSALSNPVCSTPTGTACPQTFEPCLDWLNKEYLWIGACEPADVIYGSNCAGIGNGALRHCCWYRQVQVLCYDTDPEFGETFNVSENCGCSNEDCPANPAK